MQFKLAILPSFLLNWIRYHFIISLYNLSANATAVVVIDDDDLDNMAKWFIIINTTTDGNTKYLLLG